MELQIRGHGVAITDDLRRFVDKRAAKLDHLVDRVVDAKLELRTRHNRFGPDTTTAQLTLHTGHRILRAEEHDADPFVAVDQAVDKLVRQVRRFHDKRSDRKGPRPEPAPIVSPEAGADEPDLDGDETDREEVAGLVRTKRFSLKPMDVEEAIQQMELLGHDFYLFHNAAEEGLNVVYHPRAGSYGLLVPDRG